MQKLWLIRPFLSSLVRLFQSESKCETILMKMSLICMKMKLHVELIFIWKVLHLDSFWNRGTRKLGNGLLVRLCSYTTKNRVNEQATFCTALVSKLATCSENFFPKSFFHLQWWPKLSRLGMLQGCWSTCGRFSCQDSSFNFSLLFFLQVWFSFLF